MDSVSQREVWLCDPPRGVTARRLTLRELSELKNSAEACFAKRWSENDYRYFLSSESGLCFGLFRDSELVAFALALLAQGDLDIVSIGVVPAFQRTGLAKWCLKAMTKNSVVKRIFLEVDETNAAAIKLYEGSGFIVYGKRAKYYEGKRDAILMQRSLE